MTTGGNCGTMGAQRPDRPRVHRRSSHRRRACGRSKNTAGVTRARRVESSHRHRPLRQLRRREHHSSSPRLWISSTSPLAGGYRTLAVRGTDLVGSRTPARRRILTGRGYLLATGFRNVRKASDIHIHPDPASAVHPRSQKIADLAAPVRNRHRVPQPQQPHDAVRRGAMPRQPRNSSWRSIPQRRPHGRVSYRWGERCFRNRSSTTASLRCPTAGLLRLPIWKPSRNGFKEPGFLRATKEWEGLRPPSSSTATDVRLPQPGAHVDPRSSLFVSADLGA